MSREYEPDRAAPFISARWRRADWASATFAGDPAHALSAAAWRARPKENDNSHGCCLRAFTGVGFAVAPSSDWPPDRKTTPGTATLTALNARRQQPWELS